MDARDPQPTALVIDDSEISRAALARTLMRAGFECEELESALGALTRVKARHFDVVVADVDMPDLNGPGLATRMRRRPDLFHLPIILVSGSVNGPSYRHALECGANAILRKADVATQLAPLAQRLTRGAVEEPLHERALHFLVVDDDPTQLETARRRLSSMGYRVTTRDRTFGTLNEILSCKPDYVLYDHRMPGMTGEALAKLIDERGGGADSRVLLHASIAPEALGEPDLEGTDGCVRRARDSLEFRRDLIEVLLAKHRR